MRARRILLALLLLSAVTAAPAARAVDTQAHRKKTINVLIDMGYFKKIVVADGLPHLYVTPLFLGAPFNDQQGLAALVFAYYNDMDSKYDQVIIIDGATGKRVGLFSKAAGGLKMSP